MRQSFNSKSCSSFQMLCPSNFLQIFESLEVSIWNESSPKADSIFGFNLNNSMGPLVSLTGQFLPHPDADPRKRACAAATAAFALPHASLCPACSTATAACCCCTPPLTLSSSLARPVFPIRAQHYAPPSSASASQSVRTAGAVAAPTFRCRIHSRCR
jgi:hypothetical protein